jgi:hypothetical protein
MDWKTSPAAVREVPSEDWPAWTAPLALVGALVLAATGALIVDLPALALGAKITSSHVPHGLEFADTVVQDAAFVLTAWLCATVGGRTAHAWQFGLRTARTPRAWTVLAVPGTYLTFFVFTIVWGALLHVNAKEKLLEQLGANESVLLLVLSAALTTVMAPICEEFLFRGFVFKALRKWRGPAPAAVLTGVAFGAFHLGSAPAVDIVPLAVLGLGLCLLYWRTGSLYPCIATHSLNNSIAYGLLEDWRWWQVGCLAASALVTIGSLWWLLRAAGVISGAPTEAAVPLCS